MLSRSFFFFYGTHMPIICQCPEHATLQTRKSTSIVKSALTEILPIAGVANTRPQQQTKRLCNRTLCVCNKDSACEQNLFESKAAQLHIEACQKQARTELWCIPVTQKHAQTTLNNISVTRKIPRRYAGVQALSLRVEAQTLEQAAT